MHNSLNQYPNHIHGSCVIIRNLFHLLNIYSAPTPNTKPIVNEQKNCACNCFILQIKWKEEKKKKIPRLSPPQIKMSMKAQCE